MKNATLTLRQPTEKQPDNLHAILGDNGSGKTTILQAIALTLGMATRRISALERFSWYGFVPQRLSTMGRTRVELKVLLDDEEVKGTQELFAEWRKYFERDGARLVEPGSGRELTLVFENGKVRVTDASGADARGQLFGRFYVRQLAKRQPEVKGWFSKFGDVFWYDQYRNLGQAVASAGGIDDEDVAPTESWLVGVEQLRRFMQDWWTYHVSSYKTSGRDFISELEPLFEKVFPGTHFRGPQPVDVSGAEGASKFFFLLEHGGRVFDIAEMSSGEQAVFPLICDFVRLNVKKSVVLIDELELHLHPPEQQGLLAALPKMGTDCQFIITTHSSFIEGSVPNEQETRLKEGRPCL